MKLDKWMVVVIISATLVLIMLGLSVTPASRGWFLVRLKRIFGRNKGKGKPPILPTTNTPLEPMKEWQKPAVLPPSLPPGRLQTQARPSRPDNPFVKTIPTSK
jgi:hypothetical protein